ncbi:MAG: Na/Pi symporter [Deltaproteobacteria bacterium]|nr:Na/Pi symporter [Deltaproteobacteria bacterium]
MRVGPLAAVVFCLLFVAGGGLKALASAQEEADPNNENQSPPDNAPGAVSEPPPAAEDPNNENQQAPDNAPGAGDPNDPAAAWTLEQQTYAEGMSQIVGITGREVKSPIQVKVLRDGKPAAGQKVDFRLTATPSKAEGTEISSAVVETDEEGMASVQITLGSAEGDYLVTAYLQGSVQQAEPVVTRIKAMTPSWVVLLVIGLLGGLGLFLYGMGIAGDNLQKVAGNQMRKIMKKLTRNRVMGVGVGTVASAVLQSSSAAAVMLVGFVSATMMTFSQSISVMMGTKVGVTITIQLIAFNISQYALAIVGAGAIVIMAAGKKEKVKCIGAIILGFGLIFFGLSVMSGAMRPLRGIPEFAGILLQFSDSPGLAIIVAAAFTGVIQSVAAVVAMSMALASQGLMPLEAAIPLAIGGSIGTCATALLASFGASRDGLRVAVVHLIFSVFTAVLFWPLLAFTDLFTDFTVWVTSLMGTDSVVRQIANGFMIYSVAAAIIGLPLIGPLAWVTRKLVPESKKEKPFGPRFINEQSLGVPVMALEQAQKEVERMAEIFGGSLNASLPAIISADRKKIREIAEQDEKLDILEKAIRPFLARVAQRGLEKGAAAQERALIYITADIKGAGDLLRKEVLDAADKLAEAGAKLSDEGADEIERFHGKMVSKFDNVLKAIRTQDRSLAERVLQLSFKEKQLERKLRDSHLERLQAGGEETLKSSADHLTILAGLASVGGKLDSVAEEITREM